MAYNALLIERRKLLHERAGEALESMFEGRLDDHLGDLARHYSRSDNISKAVEYLGRAGQQAFQRSAYADAISSLRAATDLLQKLPESPERLQREFTVFWALWVFHQAHGEHREAREAAAECLRLAQAAAASPLLLEAHHAVGVSLLLLGEFAQGLKQLEQGAAIFDPGQHAALPYVNGLDSGVACLCRGAWDLWFLGYPDQALKRLAEGLALSNPLSHPVSKAAAANIASWVYLLLQDCDAAKEQADAAVVLSTECAFEFWGAMGIIG